MVRRITTMARKAPKTRRPRKSPATANPKPSRGADAHGETGEEPIVEVEEFHPVEPDVVEPEAVQGEILDTEASDTPVDEDGAESGALVTVDPMSRYLAEVRRFPLLTREEESEVAKRYVREHDPADAYRLVTANLRLVVKIALEFARASRNVLDLIQEGNVGLMEAVKNFDPYRGIRFPSYAVWWVRAYIYRYLINNWRLVKIGTTQAQRKLFFNLRKESDRLEAQGFTPQPKLLAQRIGVKESEVREMQDRMAQSEVSLDAPAGANSDASLGDVLPDASGSPEDEAAAIEWRNFAHEQIEEFAATLTDKEREIFRSRLLTDEPITLAEVGQQFGISRERVRQIETRLKRRLKEFIKARASDVEEAGTH
jgi:RNA polymerase sigma-32 factor